jgi:hypothetical protein
VSVVFSSLSLGRDHSLLSPVILSKARIDPVVGTRLFFCLRYDGCVEITVRFTVRAETPSRAAALVRRFLGRYWAYWNWAGITGWTITAARDPQALPPPDPPETGAQRRVPDLPNSEPSGE